MAKLGNEAVSVINLPLSAYVSRWRPQRPLVVLSNLKTIYDNLALEKVLCDRAPLTAGENAASFGSGDKGGWGKGWEGKSQKLPLLFLWQNRAAVIIGRNQNPLAECALQRVRERGVDLTRRESGGGAVYQDLGNTCFTILHQQRRALPAFGSEMISRSLARDFGIKTENSARNDLLVNNKKFSGSAYRLTNTQYIHHGTVMHNVDLEAMKEVLTPHPLKLQQHGLKKATDSVKNRVANLSIFNPQVTHETLVDSFTNSFAQLARDGYNPNEHGLQNQTQIKGAIRPAKVNSLVIDESHPLVHEKAFLAQKEKLEANDWVFGTTPPYDVVFSRKLDFGLLELRLLVQGGVVKDLQIFTDALDETLVSRLLLTFRRALIGMSQAELAAVSDQKVIDWVLLTASDRCQSYLNRDFAN